MLGERKTLLVVFAAFALAALFAFGCNKTEDVPNHLIGTWETDAPKYRDRYLEFTPTSITFGTGGDDSLTYDIDYLEYSEGEGRKTIYDIKYTDLYGDDFELRIVYDPAGRENIVVGHIEARWYRSGDDN